MRLSINVDQCFDLSEHYQGAIMYVGDKGEIVIIQKATKLSGSDLRENINIIDHAIDLNETRNELDDKIDKYNNQI